MNAGARPTWCRPRALLLVGALLMLAAATGWLATRGEDARRRPVPAGRLARPTRLAHHGRRGWRGYRTIAAVLTHQPAIYAAGPRVREIALTFDDGPGPYTLPVVGLLHRQHARATFFTVGQMERYFGAATTAALRAGNVIADHTESHPLLARLTPAQQRAEITVQTQWLSRLRIPYPHLFRPPYGSYNAYTLRELGRLRMLMVLWSLDSRDYLRPGAAAITQRVLAGARPGAIILLHDGGGDRSQTVAALPGILAGLRARHLRTVTLPRLLRDDPPTAAQRRLPRSLRGH